MPILPYEPDIYPVDLFDRLAVPETQTGIGGLVHVARREKNAARMRQGTPIIRRSQAAHPSQVDGPRFPRPFFPVMCSLLVRPRYQPWHNGVSRAGSQRHGPRFTICANPALIETTRLDSEARLRPECGADSQRALVGLKGRTQRRGAARLLVL